MHMDIFQGNFTAKICRKNAASQMEHPDLTPAFNIYRKNPSVWTHRLENRHRIDTFSTKVQKTFSLQPLGLPVAIPKQQSPKP